MLRRANELFQNEAPSTNVLWTAIGDSFPGYLAASFKTPGYSGDLYSPVVHPNPKYLTEVDLVRAAETATRKLLLVVGPTGIGKSTLLHHTFRSNRFGWASSPVVWIDVLNDVRSSEETDAEQLILRVIQTALASYIVSRVDEVPVGEWRRFLVDNNAEEYVLYERLRQGLRADSLSDEDVTTFGLLERRVSRNRWRLVRLQAAYLNTVLRAKPLVIIDDIDQLDGKIIGQLVQIGRFLAEGSTHRSGFAPATPEADTAPEPFVPVEDAPVMLEGGADSLRVVMAVRSSTFHDLDKGSRIHYLGDVSPPDLADVLRRRLDAYLKGNQEGDVRFQVSDFRKTLIELIQNGTISSFGPASDVEKATESDLRETIVAVLHALARSLLEQACFDDVSVAAFTHRLTNFNTRLSLVAVSKLAAAGDLDIGQMFRSRFSGRPLKTVFSKRGIVESLLKGTQAVYRKSGSWVVNILSDGQPDAHSTLVRVRVLVAARQLEPGQGGVLASLVVDELGTLFGYPPERVLRAIQFLKEYSLLENISETLQLLPASQRLRLSPAGEAYLHTLLGNRTYLEAVCQDVFVSEGNLVPARGYCEEPHTRVTRVWGVVSEMFVQERREVHQLNAKGLLERYKGTFGDALVVRHMLNGVLKSWHSISKKGVVPEDWQHLENKMIALRDAATVDGLLLSL